MAIVFILALIALLHTIPIPLFNETFFDGEFENFLHGLGFSGVALLIMILQTRDLKGAVSNGRKWRLYGAGFIFTFSIGFGAELLQIPTDRDASIGDLIRDFFGTIAGLLFFASLQSKLSLFRKTAQKMAARIMAVFLVGVIATPLFIKIAALKCYTGSSGELVTFEKWFDSALLQEKGIEFSIVDRPAEWTTNNSKKVALLQFNGSDYPGITIKNVKNWADYNVFTFQMFSRADTSLELIVRIHDRNHNNQFSDRFNRKIVIAPGANEFVIPLYEIKNLQKRKMELDKIHEIIIFAMGKKVQFSVFLDQIILK